MKKKWNYKGDKDIEKYLKHISGGDSDLLVSTGKRMSRIVQIDENSSYVVRRCSKSDIDHYVAIAYVRYVTKYQQIQISKVVDELNRLVTFPKVTTLESDLTRMVCVMMYCYGPYSPKYFPNLFKHFQKQI